MSPIAVAAAAATLLLLISAIRPLRSLIAVAAATSVVAIAMQFPGHGHGAVGLSVAASLAIAAATTGARAARLLLALAVVWSLGGLLAPHQPTAVHWPILWTAGLATALVAVAGAAFTGRILRAERRQARVWLALLLALLPVGSGGPLLPLDAAIELPLADGTGAWLQTASLAFAATTLPPWAPVLWRYLPFALLALTLLAQARPRPRLVAAATATGALAIAAVAIAWSTPALAWLDGDLSVLAAAGTPFPGVARTLSGEPAVDAGPLLLLIARLASIGVLLWPWSLRSPATGADAVVGRRLDWSAMALSGALLLSWSFLAPGWAGALWVLDPAALATLAALAAAFGVLAAGGDEGRAWPWRLIQFTAALLVIGGGEVGWRVAGLLMLD